MTFPRFRDGDVQIRFDATEDPWVLHSYVLASHSPWFKASLSHRWEHKGRRARTYDLLVEDNSSEGSFTCGDRDYLILIGGEVADSQVVGHELASARKVAQKAHKMMLKAMYHVEPETKLQWSQSTKELLAALGRVADFYDCSAVIDPRMDHFLRRFWKSVLADCKRHPIRMLNLGGAVRCDWMTKECCTYLICKDGPLETTDAEGGVVDDLLGTILAKKDEVETAITAADRNLLRIRAADMEDCLSCLALSVWHRWLVVRMEGPIPMLYQQIARGMKYSGLSVRDDPLIQPSERKGIRLNLGAIFSLAKEIVDPFLKDVTLPQAPCKLDDNFRYKTVPARDLPWRISRS